MNTGQLWRSLRIGLVRSFPARIRQPRDKFFTRVLALALVSAVLAIFLTPSVTGQWLSGVFSVLIFCILVAFVRGLPEKGVVYLAAVLGLAYIFTISLTEGHVYSSTMAWIALIPLAIFYVIHPAAGAVWMVLAIVIEALMAGVAWVWGEQFASMNIPELPLMSLMDYLLVSVTIFLVPNFYQQELEAHLQARRQRQRDGGGQPLVRHRPRRERDERAEKEAEAVERHQAHAPEHRVKLVLRERAHDGN